MKLKNIAPLLVLLLAVMSSCKKNYIIGGEPNSENLFKSSTTYEMLKSQTLYDTLIQVIDAAGLKDQINAAATTFYAPSDYSILRYLAARTLIVQKTDQYAKFGLDSLLHYITTNKNGTRDSLLMYQVKQSMDFKALVLIGPDGTKLPTGLNGDSVVLSFEYTKDGQQGYSDIISGAPQLQYFTQMWKPFKLGVDGTASEIPTATGVRTLCKTSFIPTKTGYVTALDNSHTFLFFGTKK
jgi:hypothetical protein